jgi:hypothetical protein
MRRLLLLLSALAFCACVAVQFNDPDPGRWIVIYTAAAVACGLDAFGLRRPILPWGLLGVALLWAATLAAGLDGAALQRGFDDEVIRELGGLLLVAGAMGGLLASRRPADVPGGES